MSRDAVCWCGYTCVWGVCGCVGELCGRMWISKDVVFVLVADQC